MIRLARATALLLGGSVLGWQIVNAANGRFVHFFLAPDLLFGTLLLVAALWPWERLAAVAMLAGFAAMGAVFLSATCGRLLMEPERFDFGTGLTTLGLIPCVAASLGLGRWLVRRPRLLKP